MARDLEQLARHESGHAVIAHIFGYPITLVSVVPVKERGDADIRSDDVEREYPVEGTNRKIRYYLGGMAADMRYPLADANRRDCLWGWRQDMVYAWELARINAGALRLSDTQIIEKQLHKAVRLLAARWPAVTALVHELLYRTELHGPAVHAIIDRELGRG